MQFFKNIKELWRNEKIIYVFFLWFTYKISIKDIENAYVAIKLSYLREVKYFTAKSRFSRTTRRAFTWNTSHTFSHGEHHHLHITSLHSNYCRQRPLRFVMTQKPLGNHHVTFVDVRDSSDCFGAGNSKGNRDLGLMPHFPRTPCFTNGFGRQKSPTN